MLSAGGDGTSSTQENDDARLVDFLTAFEIDNSSNMPSKIQEKEEETREHEDAPPPAPRQRRLSFGGANSAKVAPATENMDLKDLGGSLVQDLERRRASESHSRWRFPMRPASVFESRLLRPSKLLRPARLLVNSEQKKILVKSPAQRMARRKHLEHAGFGHVQFDMRLRYEQEVSLAWYEKSFDHEGTFGRRWFRARVALQIYTMFRFPYRFAFGPKRVCGNCFAWIYEEGKSPWDYADYYSDLIPDLFFAADIVVNCFMTFDSAELDDEKVTDVRKIRRRYFRTSRLLKSSVPTAWLDVAGIIPFHVVWHMSSLPELAVQVASLPRLARIFKLFEWFGEIEFDAHLDFRVVALCKFTLMLFGMAHWVGCLWWLFARLRDFDETTWVALYNFAFNEHSDTSLSMVTPSHKFTPPKDNWHNYQIALYWGLNSMTGFGYSDVIPDNGVEMVFAIILCLVQLMYNAYILGTLFRCAVKKDEKSETYLKTIKHIDHYAEERRLPSELVSRMKRYVQFVASRESANQEHVLKQMPSSLVAKIAKWQHRKLLASTNVFDGVPEQYLTLLIVRLRARYLQRGDILFKMGDMAHELCFVQSGIVDEFEDDARRRPLRSVTEGILGELAFFMGIGQPCCDAASPQTDVVLQSISIEDYEDLLTSYAEGHAMAVSNIMAEFNISDSKDEANDATKKKESAGGDDHREKVRVALAATLKRRQDDALSVAVDAASEGDVETIRRIVQQGLDVNQGDYDGRTMLHLAAAEGNVKVARLLIEEGADVSVVDRWNQSPLHDAVSSEHQQVAQLLGAHGADLHFEDPAGVLCNLVAEEDFDGLKNTISFGTPPDSADYDGRTALHLAAFEGNSNFISWLIQSKANVNAVDRWGNTPLADAVKNLHELPAKILFESGSTLTHDYACSLLCDAALRGDAPFLQLLHECGTDVQDCDYDKRTALHLAAAEGQLVSVDFLIFAKSNIAFKDRWGKTAIDDAIRGGHYAVARLLQGVGGKPCGPLTPEQERLLADVDMTRTREETRCKVDAQQKSRRLKPHIRDLIKLLAREFGTADVQFARKIERLDKLATYAINKGGHEAMVAANTMSPEEAFAMPDLMLDDEEIARTNGAAEMDNRSDASDDCPNGAPYVPKGFAIRRFLGLEDLDRPDDSPPPFTSVCDEDEEQMRADGASAQNNHRRVSVGGRSEISVEDEEAVRDRRMSTDALLTNPAVRDRKGSTGSCAQVPAGSGRRVSTDILAMNREEDANLHPLVLLERNTIANSNRGTNGGKSVAKSNLETGSAAHRFTSFNQIILLFPTIEKGFELLRSRFENRGVKSFSKNDMYEFLKSDLEISEVTRKDLDEMFTLMDSNGGNSAEAEAEALDFLQLVISPSFAKLVERSADEAARVGRECIYAASIKESFSIINAAFELLDTTGKGQISIQELKNAIGGELKFGDQLVNLFARQLVIRRLDFMLSLLNWLGLVDEEEVDTLDDADTEANAIRRQSMYDGSGTGQKQQVTSESNADPASPKHGRSIFRTAMDESSRQEVASGVTKERQMADAGLALVAAYSSMRQPQGGKENTGAFDTLKDELTLAALSAYMLARHRQSTLVFFNEMWATMRFLLRPRRFREVEVYLVSMRLKDNATSIFNDMDRDFSGDIDVEEFASYIDQISTAAIPRYRVYAAFNKFAEESVITLEAFKGMWGDCVRKLDGIIGNKSEQVLLCINASRLLIIPGSTYDHVFVFLQMCASVFLCASTPYAIAFYTEKHQLIRSGVLIPMYLADFIVWLGVFRRFITAYYNKDRKLVTNLSKIRKHYSKHDLAYDLIAAIPLDALLWLANNPPYRAIMWARISRAMRVRDVYRFMKSRRSELNEIRGQLENLLVTFLVTLHFLACIWQWLTSHEENYNYQSRYYNNLYPYSGYGSFATEEGDSGTLSVEKYFLSLYWVISALIGMGAGDLHPVTGEERWFTMALMILNLSVLAYVVGIVSSLFMSADERLVKLREEIAAANTFIESRDLPRELVEEINALSNLRASSRLASDTVGNDIFRHLSTSLQIEVASHISLNLIQNTRCFYNTGQNFLDKLSTMLVEVNVPPETVLIRRSDLAKTLYLVSSGRVDLVFEDVSGRADDDENAVVLPGASVSPIPFFFNVRHTCGARSYSQGQTRLFALDRDSYKRLIKLYPDEEETISHNVLDEDSGQAASGASSGGSIASGSSGTSSQEKGSGGSASGGSAAGSAAGSQCSGTSGLASGADQNDKDGAIENIHKAIQKARSKKEKERVAARCAAAAEGKLESLKQIVEQSRTTSVDEGDYDKRTPLHLAASEGHKEVVLWLIENGASVMVRDRFGNTPMNDALRHRHDQVVGILREAGGQLERTESDTAGALCAAAYKNDLTEIKRLVENHADPNAGDYDKRTALHIAASEGHIEIINYLLSRHADVNAYDRIGGTPLSDAIRHKRIEAQHVLRKAGATVQHDDDAAAELCRLASEGDLENMRVLVDNGLDVNLGDYDGRRALHLACCEEKLAVIEFLLACPGIDLNPVDRFGGTPLEDAIRENRHTVALLLEKLGAVRAHHPSLKPKYIHLTEISEERKKQRILQDIEKDAEHAAVAKLGESLRAIVGPFSACNKHIQEQMQALILNANPKTWRSRKAIQQSPNLTPADLISDVFLGNFRKFMKHEEHAEHMLDCYLACVEFHRDPTFDSLEELLTNYIGKGARREIITVSKFVIPVQEGLDAREGTNAPRNPSSQLLDPIISELEDRLENFLKKFYKSYHFKEVITSRLGRIWRITHICRRVYSSADEMTKCVIKDIKSIANDDALRHIYGERNERINRLNSAIDEHLSKLENIKKYSTELSIGHKVIYERGQRRRQILGDVVVADQ